MRKFLSRLLLVTAALLVFAGEVVPLVAVAQPLSSDEQKALRDWTQWVADACSASAATPEGDTPVTPGSGSPTGLLFPDLNPGAMATAINDFIKHEQPSSPLNNLGNTIVASSKDANVNPFLIVGIADQETSLATADTPQVTAGHAPFNRRALSSQPHISIATGLWYKWSTFKASVDSSADENKNAAGGGDIAAYIRYQYKSELNQDDLAAFISKYDPSPADAAIYKSHLEMWMKDMAERTHNSPGTITTPAKPTIVIDPGHSGNEIKETDAQTGLVDYDYPNNPEMQEVWTVAQKVQGKLQDDGYNVVLTKSNANDTVSLRKRADIANQAKADLALSIHDSHDTSWGDMGDGNGGQVYVQKVGLYRQNKAGEGRGHDQVKFTDADVAEKSQKYGQAFAQQRTKDEGHKVSIVDANFDSRSGLASGNIPEVQLFAKVPWVYNEVGASSGPLSDSELNKYAQGLIDSVETAVPSQGSTVGTDTSGTTSCKCATATFNATTSLRGKSNREKIYNYFIDKGLRPVDAAAIVGNFGQESHWDPTISGGLAQWGGSFLTALENFANKKNTEVTDLATQLDFVWEGLTNGPDAGGFDESGVLKNMKGTDDVAQATIFFMGTASVGGDITGYENPGIPQQENRINFAKAALQDFADGAAATDVGGGGCSNSISPDCQNATGNAAILCEAKKYDPVDYVWGGGHAGGVPYHNSCPTIKSNDSACGLDCSGLVSVAVYDAFQGDGKLAWDTNAIRSDGEHWRKIPFSEVQPGDVMEPDPGHVEIVDHVEGNNLATFGAHTSSYAQPQQVGPTTYGNAASLSYYRYIGPGSGT